MTALTVPARPPDDDSSLRPVSWRRMAGVTWRQHRFALVGAATLLGALGLYLWIAGLQLHNPYAAGIACHPAGSPACMGLASTFSGTAAFLSDGVILQVVPVLIGAFSGRQCCPANWRPARSGTPGPRASAGGAGRSPSLCRSRSCWSPLLLPSAFS